MKIIESNRPDPSIAKCLEFVGSARDILLIGDAREDLLGSLDARGCVINCILVGETSPDEARVFCSAVEVAPANAVTLPVGLRESSFDIVLFDGILERVDEPRRILTESRQVLRKGGFAIARLANLEHGAIRLALVKDTHASAAPAPPDYFRGFALKGMNDLFLEAGYRLEHVEHVRRAIFNASDGLPNLQRSDFPQAVVAQVEADPASEIYQFVVKAVPLVEGAEGSSSTDSAERRSGKESGRAVPTMSPRITVVKPDPRVDITEDAVPDTERELNAERATREELLSALQDARNAAVALESRVSEIAARRMQQDASQTEERLAQIRLVDELRSQCDGQKDRIRALETDLRLSKKATIRFRQELEAERQSSLTAANAKLEAEESWFALYAELEDARVALQESEARFLVKESEYLGSIMRTEDACDKLLAEAQQVIEAAQTRFASEREMADVQHRELSASILELEDELEALHKAALAGQLVMRDYANELRQRAESAAADFANAMRERDEYYVRMLDNDGLLKEARQRVESAAADFANAMRERDEYYVRMVDNDGLLKETRQQAESAAAELANAVRARDEYYLRMLDSDGLLKETRERSTSLEAEISKLELTLAGLEESLRSATEASDAEVAVARLELSRSRAELQAERQTLQTERQAFTEKIARTESDCDERIAESIAIAEGVRLQAESELRRLEAQQRKDSATASELSAQLEAVRKASLADKLVMREYADEFRHRAAHAEKELHTAIRQRDDLYLRTVDADRAIADASEYTAHLEDDIRRLEGRLRDQSALSAQAETDLAQSKTDLADLTARATSLQNDLAHQQAVLQHLRESTDSDLAHQQAVLQHLRESADSDRARADVASAELASLTVRYEILQTNLAEIDNLLVAQTEQLLASTSDERERLLTLIDTVQSSHFWRLKHWLARLRSRIFGDAVSSRGA